VAACVAISDAVALQPDRATDGGFLLGQPDVEDLQALIEFKEVWVAEFFGATIGLAVAYPDSSARFALFRDRIRDITWETEPNALEGRCVYIDRIATLPAHRRRGVGSAIRSRN
jgi:hypothetical protein